MKKQLLLFAAFTITSVAVNAQYCMGGPSSTVDTNLQSASLVGESSSITYTGCPGVTGVEDETGQTADLLIDNDYTIDLSWGSCGGNFGNGGNAWIDYDGSGTFDADEIIATKSFSSAPESMSPTFTVPADAVVGTTRMRIMQHEGGAPPLNPCAFIIWGSVVDFTIELLPSCTDIEYTATATEICLGETITLTGIGPGIITWDGGVSDGVPFDPGAVGTYTYTPSSDDPEACLSVDPVVVSVIGLPMVNAGSGDGNYCLGDAVVLCASGDADLYIWNDGDPMDLTPGIGTHTYSLTGYYIEGACPGENSDEVTITVHDLPTVTASSDLYETCIGGSFVFTADGAETYVWNMGVMGGMPYTPNEIGVGTYTVIGTDANGCTGTASVDAEVVEGISITGVKTIETLGADAEIDITVTGGITPYTYEWNNDETTEDITGLNAGQYKVVVTGATVCKGNKTFHIESQIGVDDLSIDDLSIYPNPTSDFVNIRLEGNFNYKLHSINGDVLVNGSGVNQKEINLEDFANGVYFVTISAESGAVTIKVVKQ